MAKNFLTRKSGLHTHVLLDGGVLNVPWDQNNNFFNAYVSDILHGNRLCIAEKRLKNFIFFLDIDFYSKDDSEQLDYIKFTEELYKIVGDPGTCLVAVARPRNVPEKGTKYGIHLIWPNLVVNFQRAQSYRMKVIRELGEEWTDVIDGISSALRMLWSFKDDPTSTYYAPFGKITDGVLEKFTDTKPSPEFLQMFTIQVESQAEEEFASITRESHGLEQFIRENVFGQNDLKISKIDKCKDKTNWYIGTTSRYCENIKGLHRSNHVWFNLSASRILSQRCLDENCKKFKGRKYNVPIILVPKDDILARSSNCNVYHYFPDGWNKEKLLET